MAAGNKLAAIGIVLQQADRVGERGGANIVEGCRDHWPAPTRALWIADQMRGGVIGMSRCLIPNGESASSTACTMHGGAAIDPLSPMPLTPIGLVGEGVSWNSDRMVGTCSARGTA